MTAGNDESVPEDPDGGAEDEVEEEAGSEFSDDEEIVDIDSDAEDAEEGEEDIDAVVELSSKEQSARSLEVRRAIEERMEERRLHEDLDYLDLDLDE